MEPPAAGRQTWHSLPDRGEALSMALKATVFKAELQVSDLNHHHYQGYDLTLARHPSETDERMMLRLLAFALNADPQLSFTKGLCADDEPELWRKDLTGAIDLWVDLGQPDPKRLRRACGRARRVVLYNYGGRGADLWWENHAAALQGLANLEISALSEAAGKSLAGLAARKMQLQCTIQDGQIWLGNVHTSLEIELESRKRLG
jgi:uncharacterized protein YaeQ